jgi:hypothetical protein
MSCGDIQGADQATVWSLRPMSTNIAVESSPCVSALRPKRRPLPYQDPRWRACESMVAVREGWRLCALRDTKPTTSEELCDIQHGRALHTRPASLVRYNAIDDASPWVTRPCRIIKSDSVFLSHNPQPGDRYPAYANRRPISASGIPSCRSR